ncbi:hypothetical protein EON65_10225 [archaeon]|nr:MAG: hypothetical protein EON65_10225 [archaeon]
MATVDAVVLNVASIDWENQLQPVAFADVEQLWNILIRQEQIWSGKTSNLLHCLFKLSDCGWLTLSGFAHERPEKIFPANVPSLGVHIMKVINCRQCIDNQILEAAQTGHVGPASNQLFGEAIVLTTLLSPTPDRCHCAIS